jgi:hypothetical protein
MLVQFKINRTDELIARIEERLDFLSYNTRWGLCQIKFSEKDFNEDDNFLRELVELARKIPSSEMLD